MNHEHSYIVSAWKKDKLGDQVARILVCQTCLKRLDYIKYKEEGEKDFFEALADMDEESREEELEKMVL